MKKHLSFILPFVFLGLSVFADENPVKKFVRINTIVTEAKANTGLTVKFPQTGYGVAQVKVTDCSNGNESVFTETYRTKNGTVRAYNFSALPAGQYIVNVTMGGMDLQQVLRIYYNGNVKTLEVVNQKA